MTYSQNFIDKHRGINVEHDDWWDAVYEDFQTICKILGVHLKTRNVSTLGGRIYDKPCIWFTGFWSQGDGASFEGSYHTYAYNFDSMQYDYPADTAPEKIREHAPQDEELHRIADELCFMRRWYGDVDAKIAQSGRYYHSHSMRLDEMSYREEREDPLPEVDAIVETTIIDNMRALADWLYKQLETEHDYLTSDEAVIETLEANEFEEDLDEDETETASHAA